MNLLDLRTILVPVDFSPCSDQAVATAAGLASQIGSRIVLLYVAEISPGIDPTTVIQLSGERPEMTLVDFLWMRAAKQIPAYIDQLGAQGVQTEFLLRDGRVVDIILEAAADAEADLIVMGTHGRTGQRRVVLGSVAERVVRHSEAPVLTVRWRPEADERALAAGV